jgi:hypothetical protein
MSANRKFAGHKAVGSLTLVGASRVGGGRGKVGIMGLVSLYGAGAQYPNSVRWETRN